ncbi:hypothetical protein K466DRAFT_128917 [Polyporus arcularius HHB13444]|uniref:Uncharacterized protein n=1 Tax=Polyporus arcularius HHB13444 TaxID=1314778 RepID=A0A5C3PEL9_9APHY|nr:hypothetical protein K466DRAFT_128917 [Polyporus arcularius HHB13444]
MARVLTPRRAQIPYSTASTLINCLTATRSLQVVDIWIWPPIPLEGQARHPPTTFKARLYLSPILSRLLPSKFGSELVCIRTGRAATRVADRALLLVGKSGVALRPPMTVVAKVVGQRQRAPLGLFLPVEWAPALARPSAWNPAGGNLLSVSG